MDMWIWVIIAVVMLLGVGLVASQLFRMKNWLKNSPQLPPPIEFPDELKDR
jgi:hypothetical protein